MHHFIFVGDWSSGMIGVSKTFGGGSIPSSPALKCRVIGTFFCTFFRKLLEYSMEFGKIVP